MAKQEFEHKYNRNTGISHLTGKTRKAKSEALKKHKDEVAEKHGYKSGEHMDKERSKKSYMPGPGSPKY